MRRFRLMNYKERGLRCIPTGQTKGGTCDRPQVTLFKEFYAIQRIPHGSTNSQPGRERMPGMDASAGTEIFAGNPQSGYSAADLAVRFGGELRGCEDRRITGAQSIQKAGPQDITFAADEQNLQLLKKTLAAAALVSRDLAGKVERPENDLTLIVVSDPFQTFIEVLREFRPMRAAEPVSISAQAWVHPSVQFGEGCQIHPGVSIGAETQIGARCTLHPGVVIGPNCKLGDDCEIYPNAVLYAGVQVGSRVIIHANAVLGADGFGYRFREGRFHKIPHLGWVSIEDDVEIGAGTTIDRGMIGATVIGEGTKLDNLVMIGHNCELGKHNAFASQVGLAGSVTTGDYVRCAGQVGIADHVHLGTAAVFGAKAGIHKDMEGGKSYLGAPATEEQDQMRILMAVRKVPDLRAQMRQLEKQLAQLQEQVAGLQQSSSVPSEG